MEQQQHKAFRSMVLSIAILFIIAVLIIGGIVVLRDRMMQNTQQMGTSLTESYGRETQIKLNAFTRTFQLAWLYTEDALDNYTGHTMMQVYLGRFQSFVNNTYGGHVITPYGVVNGEIVASDPWEGDDTYDYGATEWYRQAVENPDQIYYSDVYTDAVTGEQVFTISQSLPVQGNVLAMDVFLERGDVLNLEISLPESYHFYMLDSSGGLLYQRTDKDFTNEGYVHQLLEGVQDGSFLSYRVNVTDPEGVERGVYSYELQNGWTVIMTIPIQSITMYQQDKILLFLGSVGLLSFVAMLILVIRNMVDLRRLSESQKTIRALSDSFFAIYRVNFREGTYQAIKSSPDVRRELPVTGHYNQFLDTMKHLVHPEAYEEFNQDFSLKSIAQRVQENILDYGGDYQRLFHGQYRWVNVRSIYHKKIMPGEIILCFKDVDLEKRQQDEHTRILQQALDVAKSSAQSRDQFFNSMSHDMRTPLNAVIGFSELIRRAAGDPDKVTGYTKKLEFAAKQLLMLINDILEISKLEAGKSALDLKEFNLSDHIAETCEIFRVQAEQQNKTFGLSMELRTPMVRADSFKIGQIMNNLLSNALKYSNEGASIRVEVRQFDYRSHSKFQIVVEDTGVGMSKEFMQHIFEPYARETHFTPRTTQGTGLGMPIVKGLVQQMSGEITVESTVGKGSKFTVTLPLEVALQSETSMEEGASRPVISPAASLAGQTILVAEDNEMNMEIITELLRMAGAHIIKAANGEEAVEKFERTSPYSVDAILMDMQMPVMDGCQASRAIRKLDRPDAATVPIVALTANAFAEDVEKTTAAGMNAHVPKPLDMNQLCEALARCWTAQSADSMQE